MQNLFLSCRIFTMETITSLENKKVKEWTSLHKKKNRDTFNLFLVEGEHLIEEALKAEVVDTIITDTTSPFEFSHTIQVTPAIMHKLSENVSQVHLIAVCKKKETVPQKMERVLILDGVQDPGNLGTLIRTAISFSFDCVYVSNETCDLYNDKAIRSTQGALFHIPVIRENTLDVVKELQKDDFIVIATSLEQSKTMNDIQPTSKMAFVFGNEGQGVSQIVQQQCDERLRIEMHGFESLNVAVAGGIVMYHYRGK